MKQPGHRAGVRASQRGDALGIGQRTDALARAERVVLANPAQDLLESLLAQLLRVEGWRADDDLVEQRAERIDVGPCVDVLPAQFRLLGTHVLGRADQLPQFCHHSPICRLPVDRLGHTEVDDLGHRSVALGGDQDVGRFDVTMDDRLLVRVADAVADLQEQPQSLVDPQTLPVAITGDPLAVHVLHGEIGTPVFGGSDIEDAGDVRVVHQPQRPSFALEAGHHRAAFDTQPDQLDRHFLSGRLLPATPVDHAHAAFAELLRNDERADVLRHGVGLRRNVQRDRSGLEDLSAALVVGQQ